MVNGHELQITSVEESLLPRYFPAPDELVYLGTPGPCREERIDTTFSVFRCLEDNRIIGFRLYGFSSVVHLKLPST